MFLFHLLSGTAIDLLALDMIAKGAHRLTETPVAALVVALSLLFLAEVGLLLAAKYKAKPLWLAFNDWVCMILLMVGVMCSWTAPTPLLSKIAIWANIGIWWGAGLREFFKPKLAD